MFEKLKDKIKKETAGKVATTNRKCPFCSATNTPLRDKCRKCILPLPQFPDLKGKGAGKIYQLILTDTRSSLMRIVDYVELLPLLVLGLAELANYIYKNVEIKSYFEQIVAGIVPLVAMGFYFLSGGLSATEQCRNCGKGIVIKIPIRKSAFPNSVQCWACGAIHNIEWKDRGIGYSPRPIPRTPQPGKSIKR